MTDYDMGASIFSARTESIEERADRYDYLLNHLLSQHYFAHFSMVMVKMDAENCWMAGAIAHRKYHDPAQAFALWRIAERALAALEHGIAVRHSVPEGFPYEADYEANFSLHDCYYLQHCLLFAGRRDLFARLRACVELPFMKMEPNLLFLDTRLLMAAWEGDLPTVQRLAGPMLKECKRWKISEHHLGLWQAIAARDSASLDSLLPVAEASYKKMARRSGSEPWGGNKPYNQAMFDTYTTAALKIARDVGMHWQYGNANTAELWPQDVIEYWEAGAG